MGEKMPTVIELPEELKTLTDLIQNEPTCFSTAGSTAVGAAALRATKFVFDLSLSSEAESRPLVAEFLASLAPSEAPETRSQASKKRKRDQSPSPPPPASFEATPISALYTDGMDDEQVWAQLDLRLKNVCDMLDFALEADSPDSEDEQANEDVDEGMLEEMAAFENGDFDVEDSEEDSDLESEEQSSEGEADLGEGIASLRDPSSDEELEQSRPKRRKKASSELDDDFFDLATFNAETEEAEARTVSKGGLGVEDSDDDELIDLFAPVDQENFDEEDEENAGSLFYKDFFEPPRTTQKPPASPKKAGSVRFHDEVRVKTIKPQGKNLPLNSLELEGEEGDDDEEDDDDLGEESGQEGEDQESDSESESEERLESDEDSEEESVERLKNDLFAEENDEPPPSDLSTHERRLAELREQISSFEAENVGPKDWVVMGEAGARSRPQNSLLEEDLEYERVMKAVPVVTEEKVQALEDKIKARILEGRFDDVVRIRPMDDKPFLPSRFFELQDTKSTQSLAQIYEADYVAAQTGTSVDDRDGKLKKEHAEIENLWESISAKLDALCNAHFVPKQPKATITSIANVSTATMESALPTTKSVTSMLAPEEVFATSSSDLRARDELTPQEKKALHNKQKKLRKKSRDKLEQSVDKYAKKVKGVKKQKQAALASVVKSGKGVTVVGKPQKGSGKNVKKGKS
ncbi:U3 small nucleolar ribonucleoprotein MPP10 [Mycena indigotica]|uniref:U3 small nucleolar ribonucleoprotein protein MPP10 n=1 Tax=Mycena indigotica TaxID=2126181 RepID=A0A8H6SX87_9AGAR|nr:U3 small nucleolar ribonucleoprotein MPP10 [Mycena indigotica]KAF7306953.1 U3 small nucleolar ribonucleoprotein MPP10 [Mycena indigotica]